MSSHKSPPPPLHPPPLAAAAAAAGRSGESTESSCNSYCAGAAAAAATTVTSASAPSPLVATAEGGGNNNSDCSLSQQQQQQQQRNSQLYRSENQPHLFQRLKDSPLRSPLYLSVFLSCTRENLSNQLWMCFYPATEELALVLADKAKTAEAAHCSLLIERILCATIYMCISGVNVQPSLFPSHLSLCSS